MYLNTNYSLYPFLQKVTKLGKGSLKLKMKTLESNPTLRTTVALTKKPTPVLWL